ncbi:MULTISPECIES: hypothetical protein [Bacteroides]|jgi:hypothetical protein|uniref:hypothetical protein n=1 Tax=Bacteroides TaxID=816 RepID=UPI0004D6DB3E|nr:hypothetical protein [Bacteroides fragilis]DAQ99351.1 MAG TPA: hypothetical protein [Caudoviricetes sp.]MBY2902237.1 hypothetical protein [Bacteroides fragilis]MCE8576333.1 hypothetical protein [Bacteroides fragilis]MCE8610961.1 hypothetical protein [Bacteroides fragilis]MCM0237124.1 hypothetical protein [Bacteroides fragilis]
MGRYADFLNRCKGLKDGTYKFNNLDTPIIPSRDFVTFSSGYQVSFVRPKENIATVNMDDDKKVVEAINEFKTQLGSDVFIGVYCGEPEFSFHLSSTPTTPAISLMRKYNQESIFSWSHKSIITNLHHDHIWEILG